MGWLDCVKSGESEGDMNGGMKGMWSLRGNKEGWLGREGGIE